MLSCDTSPYDIGAVLSHLTDNQSSKSIAFALHSLTAEKNILTEEAHVAHIGIARMKSCRP